MSEEHFALLFILLDLPPVKLASSEPHTILNPALDTRLLLVVFSHQSCALVQQKLIGLFVLVAMLMSNGASWLVQSCDHTGLDLFAELGEQPRVLDCLLESRQGWCHS